MMTVGFLVGCLVSTVCLVGDRVSIGGSVCRRDGGFVSRGVGALDGRSVSWRLGDRVGFRVSVTSDGVGSLVGSF